MQDILNISKIWHDPIPSLKRVIILILAVLFVESFAFQLRGYPLPFSKIYLLGLLRAVDVFILVIWGPWSLKGVDIWNVVKDALVVTFFFAGAGLLFLMGWKDVVGSSMLKLSHGLFNQTWQTLIAFFATSCFFSPVAEEFIFRGILYRIMREKLAAWICVAAVSFIFAFIHYYFNGQAPIQALMPFLGSLIFCIGYEKTKFILTPILLHISGNLIIFSSPFLRFI